MKHALTVTLAAVALAVSVSRTQDFSHAPVPFTPDNLVEFKMNLPITHLDINNYLPSIRGIYARQNTTFRFYNRNIPWTDPSLFMRLRWDSDLDASNGVTWTD